jgi:hypothetical protein
MSPKQRTEHPQETDFWTRLAGATSRLDAPFLKLVEDHKESLKTESVKIRLLVTCLRGVRDHLLLIDAARFDPLVKIIDRVLADCGWGNATLGFLSAAAAAAIRDFESTIILGWL